jgi:hypothetical protein
MTTKFTQAAWQHLNSDVDSTFMDTDPYALANVLPQKRIDGLNVVCTVLMAVSVVGLLWRAPVSHLINILIELVMLSPIGAIFGIIAIQWHHSGRDKRDEHHRTTPWLQRRRTRALVRRLPP